MYFNKTLVPTIHIGNTLPYIAKLNITIDQVLAFMATVFYNRSMAGTLLCHIVKRFQENEEIFIL